MAKFVNSVCCCLYLCVHKRSFLFTECALVSVVMPLRCYAYAKNNSNSNTVCITNFVLPSRLRCSIIFRLVRQRQTSATLLFFLLSPLLSKHKEVRILAVYCFIPLDLHFATTQACFCKDVQHVFCKSVWCIYILRGVRTWKSYAKSDLTVQTETDFQKWDLNRITNHIRM